MRKCSAICNSGCSTQSNIVQETRLGNNVMYVPSLSLSVLSPPDCDWFAFLKSMYFKVRTQRLMEIFIFDNQDYSTSRLTVTGLARDYCMWLVTWTGKWFSVFMSFYSLISLIQNSILCLVKNNYYDDFLNPKRSSRIEASYCVYVK